MALKHIIAHEIHSPSGGGTPVVSLRETPWPINDAALVCFNAVKKGSLSRSNKDYGGLDQSHAFAVLASKLDGDEIEFQTFSTESVSLFKRSLEESELSIRYHILFALESLESGKVLHGYFLEQNEAYYIDTKLDIEPSLSLDTAIKFGFKINMAELLDTESENHNRAVTLFRFRGDKAVNQFLEKSIGFGDKQDIASETDALLETVSQYTRDLPDDVASFTKSQVVNYCLDQDKSGEKVALKSLSNNLAEQLDAHQDSFASSSERSYTPPPRFDNFALENNKDLNHELIADKNKLKNFMRISGRNEQISMSFSSNCLGDSIVYDPSSDSLTVKNIPSSLKARLIKLIQNES